MGRRFGQHFLARKSILERIADAVCADGPAGNAAPLVIEVGPGRGALTGPLLNRGARVVAVEIDPVLVHYLQQKFRAAVADGQLTLLEDDILQFDPAPHLGAGERAVIAGNLPYYITSPILDKVLGMRGLWRVAIFLVQAEVAQRLAASPASRDYGYLSVLAQLQARVEILFEVPRTAFRPPPKVDSAVVRLEPRDIAAGLGIDDPSAFLRFAGVCFRQKRKTLRNNLAAVYGKALVDRLVEGKQRAEQLSLEELARLHQRLLAASPGGAAS